MPRKSHTTAIGLRSALALALAVSSLAGCRTLTGQGPLPKSVASCRQLSRQGLSARERGEWGRAEQLFSQAIEACPVDADARRYYAEALWHRGAAQEALTQIGKARELACNDASLLVRAGQYYLELNLPEPARSAADEALEIEPRSAAAWALRARALQAAGQTRDAVADYQRSLSYAPSDPEVLLSVAEAYRVLNQPERALAALQSLLDACPPGEEPQRALYLEGLALAALGRYHAAVEVLALAAQRGEPTADILCSLGEAELMAGRQVNARLAAEQALKLDGRHSPSLALLERAAATEAAGGPVRR